MRLVGESAPRRLLRPLRGSDFRRVWFGQVVSGLGDPVQSVALAWLVLPSAGTAALGAILMAGAVPRAVFTILGGVATDRYGPRVVMLFSDGARAVSVGALAVYTALGGRTLAVIAALMAVGGAATGLFVPAWSSIAPRLVPRDQLSAANALGQLTPQLALVVGAPLGGTLVALLSVAVAFGLNAISFALAAVATLSIRPVPRLVTDGRQSVLREAASGFRAVSTHRWLAVLLGVETLSTFAAVGVISIGLPVLATRRGGPGALGALLGGFGAGSVVGLLVGGAGTGTAKGGLRFSRLQLLQAPMLGALPWLPIPAAVVSLAVIGVLNGGATVLYLALIQGSVQPEVLGRVMSLASLGTFAVIPLSQVLTGFAAASGGLGAPFLLAGAILATAGAAGFVSRGLRSAP